jgi:hypothetical protein
MAAAFDSVQLNIDAEKTKLSTGASAFPWPE